MKIGCCGWEYIIPKKLGFSNWKKKFESKLELYASIFDTVEVNSTFYKFPMDKTAKKWYEQATKINPNFIFSIKTYKGITHEEKFKGKSIEYWKHVLKIARYLKAKFILIQTPHSFKDNQKNLRTIKNFFSKINYEKIVIELRGFSKENRKEICKEYGFIECVDPFKEKPIKQKIYYFRLHGKPPGKKMYYYKYKKKDLIWLKDNIPKKSFVYFNNIYMGEDAYKFKKLMNEK